MDAFNRLLQPNVGRADGIARVVCGVALITGVLISHTAWGWFGLHPLITGLFHCDPLYALLGVDTRGERAD